MNLVSDEIVTKPRPGRARRRHAPGRDRRRERGIAGNLSGRQRALGVSGRRLGAAHRRRRRSRRARCPTASPTSSPAAARSAFTGDNGFLGASYQYVDTRYGVPFVEEGETTLHPRRHRVDLRGERRNLGGFIDGVKFLGGLPRLHARRDRGLRRDRHELQEQGHRGRPVSATTAARPPQGTFGVRAEHRDYSTAGEEALAPPTTQNTFAAFVYEELTFRHLSLQFGGRVDHTLLARRRRGRAAGAHGPRLHRVLGIARSARPPARRPDPRGQPRARRAQPEPRGALQPRAARGELRLRDRRPGPGFREGLGLDVSLRYRSRRVHGRAHRVPQQHRRLHLPLPDRRGGGRPAGRELQRPRTACSGLRGPRGPRPHRQPVARARGRRREGRAARDGRGASQDAALPGLGRPALRAGAASTSRASCARRPSRTASTAPRRRPTATRSSTSTPAYTFASGRTAHVVTLRGGNLADETYRNHLSYVKDLAPEMGRSLRLVYTLRF